MNIFISWVSTQPFTADYQLQNLYIIFEKDNLDHRYRFLEIE